MLKLTPKLSSLLFVFIAATGCGSSASPSSSSSGKVCDWVTGGVRTQCTEYGAGWPAGSQVYSCVAPQMYVAGPCPHTDSGGGCTLVAGAAAHTTWSYGAANDAASVMASCSALGGTYVAP